MIKQTINLANESFDQFFKLSFSDWTWKLKKRKEKGNGIGHPTINHNTQVNQYFVEYMIHDAWWPVHANYYDCCSKTFSSNADNDVNVNSICFEWRNFN